MTILILIGSLKRQQDLLRRSIGTPTINPVHHTLSSTKQKEESASFSYTGKADSSFISG